MSLFLHLRDRRVVTLVQPVRRHTRLGDAMHLGSADLHLDRRAVGADQCRVQRLIAIDLRNGDVVLELSRHRFVQAM